MRVPYAPLRLHVCGVRIFRAVEAIKKSTPPPPEADFKNRTPPPQTYTSNVFCFFDSPGLRSGDGWSTSSDRSSEHCVFYRRRSSLDRAPQRVRLHFFILLSEAIPPGGNAVPYAYAIASVYESFPHEPR